MSSKVEILARRQVYSGIANAAAAVEKKKEETKARKETTTEIIRANAKLRDEVRISKEAAAAYEIQAQDAVDERMAVHHKYEMAYNINTEVLYKMTRIRAAAEKMGAAGAEIIQILNDK